MAEITSSEIHAIERILEEPSQLKAIFEVLQTLKAEKKISEAHQLLQKLLDHYPNEAAFHNSLGALYAADAKWPLAISAYEKAMVLDEYYLEAYYNLALLYSKLNRITEAIALYLKIVSINADILPAHYQLGILYMKSQQYESAILSFKHFMVAFPLHVESLVNLGTSYLKLGDLVSAADYYKKAFQLTPDDQQILYNLGVIHVQQGQLTDAIHYYLTALSINDNVYEIHNNLAVLYLALNDRDKALQHYVAILRLLPENPTTLHMIRLLTDHKTIHEMPKDYVRDLFNSYADHYESHLVKQLHYQLPHQMLALIREQQLASFLYILDLGCGTGLCGEIFKSMAKKLVGVDIAANMLIKAKQKNIYDELIESDLLSFLAKTTDAYELILLADVLLYFGDMNEVFQSIQKVLKNAAYLMFNIELNDNENFLMNAQGRFTHSDRYVNFIINQYGFSLIKKTEIVTRYEQNKAIKGILFLVKKTSAGADSPPVIDF